MTTLSFPVGNVGGYHSAIAIHPGTSYGIVALMSSVYPDTGQIVYDAIAFGMGEWLERMPGAIDLLYRFETNEFNGQTRLQLNVRDLKPAE